MANYSFGTTTYDNEDRLTAWTRADNNKTQSWNLSAVGDWSQFIENGGTTSRTHNEVHALTAVGSTSLTYDVKGNLTADNSLTPSQSYTWDYDNRLASAVVSGNTHSYAYDALGRRVAKTVMTGGSTTATTVFVSLTKPIEHSEYAGQVIAEYSANSAASSPNKKYIHADYIDEPVVQINVSGGSESLYYYHRNSLYSIIGLTDSTGSIIEHYAYTSYGVPTILAPDGSTVRSSSNYQNPYLFTGREYDAETGLYNYRARPYSPVLGRFVGRDPIESGLNLYRYVGNSPLTNSDPTGLFDPPLRTSGGVSTQANSGIPATSGPPPIPVPGGGADNGWKWNPNPQNSRGGSWGPNDRIPNQSQPSGSWDPEGHWDVDNGLGQRQRYDKDGNPITPDQAHGRPFNFSCPKPSFPPLTPEQQQAAVAGIGIGGIIIIGLMIGLSPIGI
jgi:RHS repeat-associated protein